MTHPSSRPSPAPRRPPARGRLLAVGVLVLAVLLLLPIARIAPVASAEALSPAGGGQASALPPERPASAAEVPLYPSAIADAGGPLARPAATIVGFPALAASTANCTCGAPDLVVVAGPTSVLEVTRSEGLVYSTDTGGVQLFSPQTLWGNHSSNLSLIEGTFDPVAHRFVVAAVNPARPYPSILLRTSVGTNPLGAWNATAILLPPEVGFVRLSVAVGGGDLGVAGTEVNATTGAILACPVWALNESEVLAGAYFPFGRPAPIATSCPSDGSPDGWVATGSPSSVLTFVEQSNSTDLLVHEVRGVPPGPLSFQNSSVLVASRSAPLPLPEPGTNETLAAPAPGISSAASSGANLSAVSTISVGGVDAIRLLVFNASLGTLVADTTVRGGGDLAYPGIVADVRDDLTIAATASNATIDPSLVSFGRPSGEAGWTTPLTWVANGTTIARTPCNLTGACAWGNGSAVAVSPSDPTTTWFAGLYAPTTSEPWSSFVAQATFPSLAVPFVSLEANAVDVGQWQNFTAVVTGGVGGYSYNWSATPPPGCTARNASVMTCVATTTGRFPVQVAVRDASGRAAVSPVVNFTVDPALSVPPPSHLPTSADVGETVEWTVAPTGGAPPYRFSWTSSAGTTCLGTSGPFANCTSALVGRVGVAVSVTDLNLRTRSNTSSMGILSAPSLRGLVIEPDPTVVGTPVHLSISASGGSGGYTFAWADLPGGCVSVDRMNFTCVPQETGNFSVTVSANDSNGLIALANATLHVGPAPPAPPSPPPSAPAWVLPVLVGSILVVAAVAVLLLVRRRRGSEIVPVETDG